MNLYDLIQHIPEFIAEQLIPEKKGDQGIRQMVGKFYLGLNYDYQ
jgi:hypothetical protein